MWCGGARWRAVEEAGDAFYRAGMFHKELKNEYDMQNALTEAAKAFRKGTSHDRSMEIMTDLVIPHMLENGKHGQAAKVSGGAHDVCVAGCPPPSPRLGSVWSSLTSAVAAWSYR